MERHQQNHLFGSGNRFEAVEAPGQLDRTTTTQVGSQSDDLEKQMLEAATFEALSLAWLSGAPQKTYPVILETKIRDAEAYLRRQSVIRGKTERILSMAF
ncbi:MAG: hypothetical protein HOI66_11040 [Verrucomicrobia bacterium]|jgi:hypothetical protein|nr:hypothetical protein [Verrucomicrobiota bacterium]